MKTKVQTKIFLYIVTIVFGTIGLGVTSYLCCITNFKIVFDNHIIPSSIMIFCYVACVFTLITAVFLPETSTVELSPIKILKKILKWLNPEDYKPIKIYPNGSNLEIKTAFKYEIYVPSSGPGTVRAYSPEFILSRGTECQVIGPYDSEGMTVRFKITELFSFDSYVSYEELDNYFDIKP